MREVGEAASNSPAVKRESEEGTTGEWIYQQAEHCARQADAQTDSKVKQQFLELKRLWLLLAHAQSLTNSSEPDRPANR
jgi:hypothetical protein